MLRGSRRRTSPADGRLMEVNVSDFVLEKGSLISLDRDMKQGELGPIVYRAIKGDTEYSVSIGLEEEEEEGSVFISWQINPRVTSGGFMILIKNAGQDWMTS